MSTQQNRYSGPCTETKGPEVFYGYCHDTGRMRMMDYNDYVGNVQKGYANLYQSPTTALQQMVDMAQAAATTTATPAPQRHSKHHGCNCREDNDCGCNCC